MMETHTQEMAVHQHVILKGDITALEEIIPIQTSARKYVAMEWSSTPMRVMMVILIMEMDAISIVKLRVVMCAKEATVNLQINAGKSVEMAFV